MIKMKHLRERGEIATILTLGVLVVIGVSAMVSSLFLNQKKTTGSQAAVTCDDPKWACGPECASKEVRNVYGGNSDKWRAEAGKIYGGCDKESQPIPPTPSCPGKYDNNGSCNPACCNSDSQCSDGQKCNIPNGFCKSTTSCNPNKEAKFHETCVGGACVKQACPDTGTCVDDCSSCSGGGATTTNSGGGATSIAPATDCTPGRGGFNGGTYYCCYPANGGQKKYGWPHYEPEGDKEVSCAEKTGVGQTTGTEEQTTCKSKGGYLIGAGCKNLCSTEPSEANWSCDQGGWCCPPEVKPTKPNPTPTGGCSKAYASNNECIANCGNITGWACMGTNNVFCCPSAESILSRTPTPSSTPTSNPSTSTCKNFDYPWLCTARCTETGWSCKGKLCCFEGIGTGGNVPTSSPAPTKDMPALFPTSSLSSTPQPTTNKESKPKLTNTPIPTVVQQAFCPNPNIPSFPPGVLVVGLYNERGDGSSVDLANIINGTINAEIRKNLQTAKNINEVRSIVVNWIYSGFIYGASSALTDIAKGIDTSGLNTITIKLAGYTFNQNQLFTINGNIKTMAIQLNNVNFAGTTFNSLTNAYVGSVINTICK